MVRNVFADYVRSQNSLRLTECSIFAANHSAAIQSSVYLSSDVKRAKALVALKSYQEKTVAHQESGATDAADAAAHIGAEYEDRVVDDLLTMNEQQWSDACQRDRHRAENEIVKQEKFITSNVRFNAISLIIGLGKDPEFTEACDVDVLQYFLGAGAKCLNLKGKSLILTMLDYSPQREDSQVLLGNLYRLCNLSSSTDNTVESLEERWTHQVVRSLYNLTTDTVKNLRTREVLILLTLNEDAGFKYCFGNQRVKNYLNKIRKTKSDKKKAILASRKRPIKEETDDNHGKKVKKGKK